MTRNTAYNLDDLEIVEPAPELSATEAPLILGEFVHLGLDDCAPKLMIVDTFDKLTSPAMSRDDDTGLWRALPEVLTPMVVVAWKARGQIHEMQMPRICVQRLQ